MENLPEKLESQLTTFSSSESFELAQRMAKMIMVSDLIPDKFKGNVSNCVIALNMATRIGADPLMVMQNLYIVHGKPSWSSTFLIAAINGSGKFKGSLKFELSGAGDSRQCVAWINDFEGNKLESPPITMAMAKSEGWESKSGSKWKTMPELMLRYRAAACFSRLYCPEITMGMQTVEEVQDVEVIESRMPQPEIVKSEKQGAKPLEEPKQGTLGV